MFKAFNIRMKLIAMILTILIPVLVLESINISEQLRSSVENELQSNIQLAQAISHSFISYLEEIWIREADISTYIASNPDLSSEQISSYLGTLMENQSTIQTLTWISPEGLVRGSSRQDMLNRSLRDREYVVKILEGQEKFVSNLMVSLSTGIPILPVARGIKKDGKLKGIMLAVVNISKLGEKFSNLSFCDGEVFQIIDGNGMIVYSNDEPDIFLQKQYLSTDDIKRKALEGQLIRIPKYTSNIDGIARMSIAYPVNQIGWAIAINSRYDVVLKNGYKKMWNSIFTLMIVMIFSIGLAMLLSHHISLPIIKLRQTAAMITKGDFSVRTNISGYDEIAVTSQVFDRMAESVEQYDKLKSEFFSNISHELKTPINVIFATAQLLSKIQDDPDLPGYQQKVQKHMTIVIQNCYRLIRLVNNLIDITRYDNGFLKLNPEKHNIVQVVEEIVISVVKYAQAKGITILFDTDTEENLIQCDPDIIERIILNLLSNSIKFTNPGGSITVSVIDKQEGVSISVKDTGIGIPQDKLDIIFDRFRQVDSSLSRNHEGSGIGLSLVKTLVETHKGKIFVTSKPGDGTEFTIELPSKLNCEADIQQEDIKDINVKSLIERANIEFSDIYFNSL